MGFLLLSGASSAAPSAELWERWLNHEPDSELTIDHQAWSTFLNRYLKVDHSDGVNRVAYGGVSEQDRQSLRDYIQRLSTAPVSTLNRSEQKAFWINLYNAITVDVVLTHYPVRSIKKIRLGGLFSGPWDAPLVTIEGEALSLNDIEHRILRPIWRDPLIHYGVNCASLGCPNLLQEAYTGRNVDRLLAQNAKSFINNRHGAEIGKRGIRLSKIYRWFEADFGASPSDTLEHLRRYADPALVAALEGKPRIKYQYDWTLNDHPVM